MNPLNIIDRFIKLSSEDPKYEVQIEGSRYSFLTKKEALEFAKRKCEEYDITVSVYEKGMPLKQRKLLKVFNPPHVKLSAYDDAGDFIPDEEEREGQALQIDKLRRFIDVTMREVVEAKKMELEAICEKFKSKYPLVTNQMPQKILRDCAHELFASRVYTPKRKQAVRWEFFADIAKSSNEPYNVLIMGEWARVLDKNFKAVNDALYEFGDHTKSNSFASIVCQRIKESVFLENIIKDTNKKVEGVKDIAWRAKERMEEKGMSSDTINLAMKHVNGLVDDALGQKTVITRDLELLTKSGIFSNLIDTSLSIRDNNGVGYENPHVLLLNSIEYSQKKLEAKDQAIEDTLYLFGAGLWPSNPLISIKSIPLGTHPKKIL